MTLIMGRKLERPPITWLFFLNYFILQWFFVRLARFGINQNGKFVQTSWGWLTWVYPLTGWSTEYKYCPWKKRKDLDD